MTASSKRYLTAFAATAVLALGLHGCGGGGGGGPTTGGDTMMPDDGETMMPDDGETMMPDDGMATEFGDDRLTASPLASPEASSSADTLVSFVDSDTPFAPVVAPIKRDTNDLGNPGLVLLEEDDSSAYVESVTVLNQQGRFRIVYVVNDQRTAIEFGPEHVVGEDQVYEHYRWYRREVDNIHYDMWTHPTFYNLQPVDRQYFGLFGWEADGRRGFASSGVLTPPDRLTSLGSATYEGQMVADSWNNFLDPNLYTNRARLWGALTLEANFSNATVAGAIDELWYEPPGTAFTNEQWSQFPATTSIEILEGDIEGNRFHADWEGRDTNSSADLSNSVLGFDRSLLGEFYGPYGEEVGGVITGQRESDDQLIHGVFGAEKQ